MTSTFLAGMISRPLLTPQLSVVTSAIVGLPLMVAVKLGFKPRSGRGRRSDPVRLLGLCCGYHIEPIGKESALRRGQR